jgi:predicted metal-dependent HD superfamily phosphohydrolase
MTWLNEEGIGTGTQRIPWSDVSAVGIRATADGPWVEDVTWIFLTHQGAIELPGAAVSGEAVAVMSRRLAGLDCGKVIAATTSMQERVWRVWHAEEARWRLDEGAIAARFGALVHRLGGRSKRAEATWARLRAAWASEGRRYHNLEHLMECLGELDGVRASKDISDTAELALFYHDAVYEPRAHSCEERSAKLLCEDARALEIPCERALASAACVRATAHFAGAKAVGPAQELVVDIDLAILGRDPLRFLEYEYAVAEEFADPADLAFTLARGRFLASLLRRPAIFQTEGLRDRHERRARANIAALFGSPRYRAHRWLGPIARYLGARCVPRQLDAGARHA